MFLSNVRELCDEKAERLAPRMSQAIWMSKYYEKYNIVKNDNIISETELSEG